VSAVGRTPSSSIFAKASLSELHIAIAPVLLGGGERLFEGVDLRALGYECVEFVASEKATHVVLRHQGRADANE
jgi:dihydrofolate reductase